MRVQVFRVDGRSESHRVDLDFYLIAAWRLMEQIRQAWVGYHVPGAEELWHEFNTRFPYIDETRDWWIHATDRIVNHSYFADEIMRWTQPPSFVIRTDDLPDLERMYERSCELLGPLPDSKSRPRANCLRPPRGVPQSRRSGARSLLPEAVVLGRLRRPFKECQ
jgi:hypothetical protein